MRLCLMCSDTTVAMAAFCRGYSFISAVKAVEDGTEAVGEGGTLLRRHFRGKLLSADGCKHILYLIAVELPARKITPARGLDDGIAHVDEGVDVAPHRLSVAGRRILCLG